jgi:hypothetical protein
MEADSISYDYSASNLIYTTPTNIISMVIKLSIFAYLTFLAFNFILEYSGLGLGLYDG